MHPSCRSWSSFLKEKDSRPPRDHHNNHPGQSPPAGRSHTSRTEWNAQQVTLRKLSQLGWSGWKISRMWRGGCGRASGMHFASSFLVIINLTLLQFVCQDSFHARWLSIAVVGVCFPRFRPFPLLYQPPLTRVRTEIEGTCVFFFWAILGLCHLSVQHTFMTPLVRRPCDESFYRMR